MRKNRKLLLGLITVVWLAGSAAAAEGKAPTFGSARFADEYPQFLGAGEVRPDLVGDGNTCAGQASELTWTRWGKRRARAEGSTCDFPDACTAACATPTDVRVVAFDLGRCGDRGRRVYRKARWRARDVDTGEWKPWSSMARRVGKGGRMCRSAL